MKEKDCITYQAIFHLWSISKRKKDEPVRGTLSLCRVPFTISWEEASRGGFKSGQGATDELCRRQAEASSTLCMRRTVRSQEAICRLRFRTLIMQLFKRLNPVWSQCEQPERTLENETKGNLLNIRHPAAFTSISLKKELHVEKGNTFLKCIKRLQKVRENMKL